MLAVFGSVSLDTIRTPKKVSKGILGGAAVFAGVSASYFTKTGLIGAIGKDFGAANRRFLAKRLDLRGLEEMWGRTFRYDGIYNKTLTSRRALKTELNVLGEFEPKVPEAYKKCRFVYLATNDPAKNVSLLGQFDRVRFSMCDTMDFWISTRRRDVVRMLKRVDASVINDEEARLLTKEHNLAQCAKKIMAMGPAYVIIKKGEHGSLLFSRDGAYAMPGFVLDKVLDPTGAGDAFAGAVMGHMAERGSASHSALVQAMAYGNVMGSFAVQGYGLDGIACLKKRGITSRAKEYAKMAGV